MSHLYKFLEKKMSNLEQLMAVLGDATSLDTVKRTKAMDTLSIWEKQQGFHAALQRIYCDGSNPQKVRSLAIICLKNGVGKYWRKSAHK
jgi:hypothetical protein